MLRIFHEVFTFFCVLPFYLIIFCAVVRTDTDIYLYTLNAIKVRAFEMESTTVQDVYRTAYCVFLFFLMIFFSLNLMRKRRANVSITPHILVKYLHNILLDIVELENIFILPFFFIWLVVLIYLENGLCGWQWTIQHISYIQFTDTSVCSCLRNMKK